MRVFVITCSVFALSVSCCHAAIISAASGTAALGTTSVALTPGANAFLTAAPVIVTGAVGNEDFIGPGVNPNTVSLTLDVYAMGPSFAVNFTVVDDGTAAQDGSTEYLFAVTLLNQLNANGVDPEDSGKEINGVDIEFAGAGGQAFDSNGAFYPGIPTPTATGANPFPLQFGGVIIGGGGGGGDLMRFGGLSGGGGGIPFGTSNTLFFSVDIADFSPGGASPNRNFSVVFTANPEPTTFILAGMALVPGGLAVRRRRNRKVDASDEIVV